MKKIVALVLTLVLALSLSATAFAAITLWGENGATAEVDMYDGKYNTKVVDRVEMTYHAANAPVFKKDVCEKVGNVAYYTIGAPAATATGTNLAEYYIVVPKIPADAKAENYVIVKAHTTDALGFQVEDKQTSKDGVYFMKAVDAVHYVYTATEFTAWADGCEKFADPKDDLDYYTCEDLVANVKIAATDAADGEDDKAEPAESENNALVNGAVVTLDPTTTVKAAQHVWVASKFDSKSVATEYTCSVCKTVGTVINASVNAPAGYAIDKLADGTLVAYKSVAGSTTASGVESAKTFDAGIAMYVGMSLMAVTGSAVVIGKKKEF